VHRIGGEPLEPFVGADRACALNPGVAQQPTEELRFDVAFDDRKTYDRHEGDYRSAAEWSQREPS
jgi:hypothetical protein